MILSRVRCRRVTPPDLCIPGIEFVCFILLLTSISVGCHAFLSPNSVLPLRLNGAVVVAKLLLLILGPDTCVAIDMMAVNTAMS
jgi:hypothetical protein